MQLRLTHHFEPADLLESLLVVSELVIDVGRLLEEFAYVVLVDHLVAKEQAGILGEYIVFQRSAIGEVFYCKIHLHIIIPLDK